MDNGDVSAFQQCLDVTSSEVVLANDFALLLAVETVAQNLVVRHGLTIHRQSHFNLQELGVVLGHGTDVRPGGNDEGIDYAA